MQKAYEQMNLKLHHVISDITGVSGLDITDAILSGERDPRVLASLRNRRIKASPRLSKNRLVGDYFQNIYLRSNSHWKPSLLSTLIAEWINKSKCPGEF